VVKKTDKQDAHRQQELTAEDQEIISFKIRAFKPFSRDPPGTNKGPTEKNYFGQPELLPRNMVVSSPPQIDVEEEKQPPQEPLQAAVRGKGLLTGPSAPFIPFTELEMERIQYHLAQPLQAISHVRQGSETKSNSLNAAPMNSSDNQVGETGSDLLSSEGTAKPKRRKREATFTSENMLELITQTVTQKWKKYLKFKSERGAMLSCRPRPDTIWKKIFRDVREFYRILFRQRFHHLDYNTKKDALR